ncbi:MAG: hypothetical protein IPI81_10600 [Flavobacteriales bacterium]|nr:hypothetical protein [Flavobacteriales bacterium]MCC6939729.1 hypothetical protein [Flavobacteriales bacterium]
MDLGIQKNSGNAHLQYGTDLFNMADVTIGRIAERPDTYSVGLPRSIYIRTDENVQSATLCACNAVDT